jgi:hypothetical protein
LLVQPTNQSDIVFDPAFVFASAATRSNPKLRKNWIG